MRFGLAHADQRGLVPCVAKALKAVKGQVIGIVLIVGAAGIVIESGASDSDDIVLLEQPIDILESVGLAIRMLEDDFANRPVPQVGRAIKASVLRVRSGLGLRCASGT